MGAERDEFVKLFDIIQAHLRAKGHEVRRDDSNDHLHLVCAGVMIDHVAGVGICVAATSERGPALILAALADLEAPEHAPALGEIRRKLASTTAAGDPRDNWGMYIDLPDCCSCDGPCDLPCDLPGCDL